MEETISLKELLATLRKRILLILSLTFVAVLTSGIISFYFLTPIYQTSTQLLVNQAKNDQPVYNPGEIQTNLQLINTYNVIIKSPAILDLVIDKLDLDMTTDQLNSKITVGSQKDSQVVAITVEHPDPKLAADIANTTASVFHREIKEIMNIDNVTILAKAEVKDNMSPIKPQPVLNIAIALVVGLMAGVGLALLLEYFDNSIKDEQDIERHLDLPILGVISIIEDSKNPNSRNERAKGVTRAGGENAI
ncbi:capsular polysaccharide biosynthesis protein [Cytobacillus oceanisediminis]|uniref:Capsular polysaccharide biosynthesis protein n=1 Tax=Cytobacillus oceanisediminis TaxID=665099 RepID=A0A2V3ACL4_9BACI|nr:Wzz/FepE/Etk N-terminal domain-containing protein [Cytobacillus oceanisediminis]PWW31264.1 capsular polysaccharide biosynthesis protein [Cytobacillus oceanisediminis]